jgi:hypothetical protein
VDGRVWTGHSTSVAGVVHVVKGVARVGR